MREDTSNNILIIHGSVSGTDRCRVTQSLVAPSFEPIISNRFSLLTGILRPGQVPFP